MALPGAGGGGRRPDFSAARRALNASSVLDPAPDGLKVDSIGRVYCTGPGGIWVFAPDGKRVGIIRWPEQAVNFAFGGPDLRTLLCCAHTSVYTLRVKVPGNPHPWYKLLGV